MDYKPDRRAFRVGLDTSKLYEIELADLSAAALADVRACSVEDNGTHFEVEQGNGNLIEVPWDLVLHLAEPTYEYYRERR